MKKTKQTSTPEDRVAFGARLRKFLKEFSIEQKKLAGSGRVSEATISAYLAGKSQPAADIISNWIRDYKVNANWLLTGEGEMLINAWEATGGSIPAEEISAILSPAQREMYTYKRIQTELGMPNARIAEGIEAIVRGKSAVALALGHEALGHDATTQEMDSRFDNARGDEAMYKKDT